MLNNPKIVEAIAEIDLELQALMVVLDNPDTTPDEFRQAQTDFGTLSYNKRALIMKRQLIDTESMSVIADALDGEIAKLRRPNSADLLGKIVGKLRGASDDET